MMWCRTPPGRRPRRSPSARRRGRCGRGWRRWVTAAPAGTPTGGSKGTPTLAVSTPSTSTSPQVIGPRLRGRRHHLDGRRGRPAAPAGVHHRPAAVVPAQCEPRRARKAHLVPGKLGIHPAAGGQGLHPADRALAAPAHRRPPGPGSGHAVRDRGRRRGLAPQATARHQPAGTKHSRSASGCPGTACRGLTVAARPAGAAEPAGCEQPEGRGSQETSWPLPLIGSRVALCSAAA
jgi:hypothetical protein